jgi:hypothetical protein
MKLLVVLAAVMSFGPYVCDRDGCRPLTVGQVVKNPFCRPLESPGVIVRNPFVVQK